MILRFLPFVAMCLTACAAPAQAELRPYIASPVVTFSPLPGAPDKLPAGVRYVGTWAMKAEGTSWFAGLSDLHVDGNGAVVALSDLGQVAQFRLSSAMTPSAVTLTRLRDVEGMELTRRNQADAEDMAVDSEGDGEGGFVSFERFQRIVFYATWSSPGVPLRLTGLPTLPHNEGMEALTLIEGGLLIGAESGGFWLCALDGGICHQITGPTTPGFLYKLVSLEALPGDDGILALYRYFDPLTGPRNVLRLLRIEDGRLVTDRELVRIDSPLPVDNYEGVSAVKTATGYRLYLISDSLTDEGLPRLMIFDWTP